MWVTWVSLAVIMLTGVVRMVTWKVFGWTGDVARDRIRLLKVKHAILGVVFAGRHRVAGGHRLLLTWEGSRVRGTQSDARKSCERLPGGAEKSPDNGNYQ